MKTGLKFLLSGCFSIAPAMAQQANLSPDEMAIILGTFVTQARLCPDKPREDYPLGAEILKLGHNITDFLPGGVHEKLMDVRIGKAVEFAKMKGEKVACAGYKEYLEMHLPSPYEKPKPVGKRKG